MQVSLLGQLERYSNSPDSILRPCSPLISHFLDKNKVVPRFGSSPGHLEPFNCIGLFTTTHAIKHRSLAKSMEKTWHEQRAVRNHSSSILDRWSRLPNRNSGSGSIGIGLISGLRTLFSTSLSHLFNKVVPRSVVNLDHLEPFNCIGLFTTTHAIKLRSPVKSVEKTWREQLATDAHSSIKVDKWNWLPYRNSEPGSIGIGLFPSLRTLFYEL
jgi:hypothetical protein